MRPLDVQVIGEELAVKWPDGGEDFIPLAKLRRACPCAGCQGEVDIMGQLHKGPDIPLVTTSFQVSRLDWVGTYGLQPVWGDGHSSGIFTFDLLRQLARSA